MYDIHDGSLQMSFLPDGCWYRVDVQGWRERRIVSPERSTVLISFPVLATSFLSLPPYAFLIMYFTHTFRTSLPLLTHVSPLHLSSYSPPAVFSTCWNSLLTPSIQGQSSSVYYLRFRQMHYHHQRRCKADVFSSI